MGNDGFLVKIERDTHLINRFLKDNLSSHVSLIADVGSHILLNGGKRLRPMLFVLASRLCNYQSDRAYYFATLFEYLHAATLLHDDVIDSASKRRGRETANVIWNNSAAVLVGDFLYSKSFALAAEMGQLKILNVLSSTTNRMAEGMVLELIHTHNLNITTDQYLEIITCKTAALMAASARIGGMMGTATKEEQHALESFGLNLGIAFQMVDDALDYTLSEEEFGKPVGKDLEEGKITLPLIYSIQEAADEDRKTLNHLASKGNYRPSHYPGILALVKRHGGIEKTLALARQYTDSAIGHLAVFPGGEYKEILTELASFVVYRKH